MIKYRKICTYQRKGQTMQTARRNFLKYASIVGITSLTGISLYAESPEALTDYQMRPEGIGATHMDEHFDPEGWL